MNLSISQKLKAAKEKVFANMQLDDDDFHLEGGDNDFIHKSTLNLSTVEPGYVVRKSEQHIDK